MRACVCACSVLWLRLVSRGGRRAETTSLIHLKSWLKWFRLAPPQLTPYLPPTRPPTPTHPSLFTPLHTPTSWQLGTLLPSFWQVTPRPHSLPQQAHPPAARAHTTLLSRARPTQPRATPLMSTSTPPPGGGPEPAPPAPPLSAGGNHDDDHDNDDKSSPLADNTSSPVLEDVLERLPDLFEQMVVPSSSSARGPGAAPLSPPPEPPAAVSHGGGADADDHDHDETTFPPPLLDLLQRFPDLFEKFVLERLDPTARASLARTGSAFWDVMFPRSLFPLGLLHAETPPLAGAARVFKLVDFLGIAKRMAWAKANGCPWNADTCHYAARGGHLAALQWAREHNCPWNTVTCWSADAGGHLKMLQWAREHDCPWNEGACYFAAEGGHLEVLKWARAHGCPWIKRHCRFASRDHPETRAWVRQQPE